MGDISYNQIKKENIVPPDIVCEDCGSKWTAMLTDIPVCVLINDLDEYSHMLCKNMSGAPDPPLVLYVFCLSDRELTDTKITLSCVVQSQSSPLQWIITHNATGLRAPMGCQIMPKKCDKSSDIFEDSHFGFHPDVTIKEEEIKIESQEDFSNKRKFEIMNLNLIEDDLVEIRGNKDITGNEEISSQAKEIHNNVNLETSSSIKPTIHPRKTSNKINRSPVADVTPTVLATTAPVTSSASTVLTTAHISLKNKATAIVASTAVPTCSTMYQNIKKRPSENTKNSEEKRPHLSMTNAVDLSSSFHPVLASTLTEMPAASQISIDSQSQIEYQIRQVDDLSQNVNQVSTDTFRVTHPNISQPERPESEHQASQHESTSDSVNVTDVEPPGNITSFGNQENPYFKLLRQGSAYGKDVVFQLPAGYMFTYEGKGIEKNTKRGWKCCNSKSGCKARIHTLYVYDDPNIVDECNLDLKVFVISDYHTCNPDSAIYDKKKLKREYNRRIYSSVYSSKKGQEGN